MKKIIFIILMLLFISSFSEAQNASLKLKDLYITRGLSLYNLNGNRWLYANGSDSSLVVRSIPNIKNFNLTGEYNKGDRFSVQLDGNTPSDSFGVSLFVANPEEGIYFQVEKTPGILSSIFNVNSSGQMSVVGRYPELIIAKIITDSIHKKTGYLVDSNIVIKATLLPNGTRLYNIGSGSAYWLNTYTQNLYADTVKKSIVADSSMTTASYKQKSVVTIADSVLNCNLSNTFQKTLSANQRFVIENIGDGQTINIAVTNTTDNYTVLFVTPTGALDIKWADATAPTLTLGVKTDVFTFVRIGSVIYGNAIQNF